MERVEGIGAVGARFATLRHWLDVSHRALGRLAQKKGVEMHESLWATWEQRSGMVQDETRVLAVLRAVAGSLDGDTEKLADLMFGFLKGEKALPKKAATWKDGEKPVLTRGRRPGSHNAVPGAPPSPELAAETRAIQQLATEIAVDYATKGEKLPEKVGKLIQAILSGSAKRALGAIIVALGLVGGMGAARAATLNDGDIESSFGTPRELKRLRRSDSDEDSESDSSGEESLLSISQLNTTEMSNALMRATEPLRKRVGRLASAARANKTPKVNHQH